MALKHIIHLPKAASTLSRSPLLFMHSLCFFFHLALYLFKNVFDTKGECQSFSLLLIFTTASEVDSKCHMTCKLHDILRGSGKVVTTRVLAVAVFLRVLSFKMEVTY